MNEATTIASVDKRATELQEQVATAFREQLESALRTELKVKSAGPYQFDFKELKSALPGEVLFATVIVGPNGSKMYFGLSRESAIELINVATHKGPITAFVTDEHLQPIRKFLEQVAASLLMNVGSGVGKSLSVNELRCVLIDVSQSDVFASGGLRTGVQVQGEPDIGLHFIASREFLTFCYPGIEVVGMTSGELPTAESGSDYQTEMDLVLDIELGVTIELGRTNMLIRDIVKLGPGSVVELDKLSGEPVDLYVNGRKFARGEVVVVDENFAVRITELSSPTERAAASRN